MVWSAGHDRPRLLLRRLRHVMAQKVDANDRLAAIVKLVANEMVAEVCSIYVLRIGEVLELFATQGLRQEAVHQTRLRVGEGLVGTIAASANPLALPDAQSHPNFAYRPETGEEIYHSFLGTPILRSGRVIGVMVVQNRTRRQYSDEEIEALEIAATLVAEIIGSGEIIDRSEIGIVGGYHIFGTQLRGLCLHAGLAVGKAVLHERSGTIDKVIADDPAKEHERLSEAVRRMHQDLDRMLARVEFTSDGSHREIMESVRMIASDRGWLSRIGDAIRTGLTAEAAVQKTRSEIQGRMREIHDPYLRERAIDFDDLALRLLNHLFALGREEQGTESLPLPEQAILVARNMGPAELLDYDSTRLCGLILEEGSDTSHVVIVARALDIPVVAQVPDALARVSLGDDLILDAHSGEIYLRPADELIQTYQERMQEWQQLKSTYLRLRDLPAVTQDGVTIDLHMNAGLLIDMPHLKHCGAKGIGLFRTEIPFMLKATSLGIETQTALYEEILNQADGKEVVFRTFDIGGDKLWPHWGQLKEENPAMGWRALRVGLDRPALLRQQFRALLCASKGRPISVMLPMVGAVGEVHQARAILAIEQRRFESDTGTEPQNIRFGVMLEIPALLFSLPSLLKEVDFLSVGSNDLHQFLFACDRGNPIISRRYEMLSIPLLRALQTIAQAGKHANKPVSLCGEMAGDTIAAMALIGLGFRQLSMAPRSIGPVKRMIRSLNLAAFQEYLGDILEREEPHLLQSFRHYAHDHQILV